MNDKIIIVVPVHKSQITEAEIRSLQQLFTILYNYKIRFVFPDGLDMTVYKDICLKFPNISYELYSFSTHFFEGIYGYNQLFTSLELHQSIKEFDYMLIYQIDAFVFRDELEYWCNQDFDYIGAPWFEQYTEASIDSPIIGAGNGGLSLKDVKKSYKILIELEKRSKFYRFLRKTRVLGNRYAAFLTRLRYGIPRNIGSSFIIGQVHINEDRFWGQMVPQMFDYKVASVEESIKFSFEANPSLLYEMNNKELPFGCHAWERYEPEFWREFI